MNPKWFDRRQGRSVKDRRMNTMRRMAAMSGAAQCCVPVVASVFFLLAGCAGREEKVESVEELLSASGFTTFYAQNPQQQANLEKIPQRQLVAHRTGKAVTYLYADDELCDCVYVGDQQAEDRLKQLAARKVQADKRLMASELKLDMTENPQMWMMGSGFGY
jgi:hypothetical protein